MKTTIIYGAIDPRTSELRYVGKTKGTLKARLAGHLRAGTHTHRGHWFRSLRNQGVAPDMFVIERVPEDSDWRECEQFWIAYFRSIGCNLVNTSVGGDGATGVALSEDRKAALSRFHKGRPKSEAHRMAILATGTTFQKGMVGTRTGLPCPEHVRRRITETQKGKPKKKWSDEDRAAHCVRMAGKGAGRTQPAEQTAKFKATMAAKYATGWSPWKSRKAKAAQDV